MIISIASGKGGTGKTSVATSLAFVLNEKAQILDCDVEEPNCHLLLRPEIETSTEAALPVPSVDKSKCNACGVCGDICQFSAIVVIGDEALTFPEMCHGCGGCALFCPENAITEVDRILGVVETGRSGDLEFVHGRLRVGEAMSPPLIKAVKDKINKDKIVIIDSPPGASCPVIGSVKDTDFIALVTEPTPFGLNDLEIAVSAIKPLGIPMGVIINRSDIGNNAVKDFCAQQELPVIMEIPHSDTIARGYAAGKLLVEADPSLKKEFLDLYDRMDAQINRGDLSALGGAL